MKPYPILQRGAALALCLTTYHLSGALVVDFDTDTAGVGSLETRTNQQNIDIDGDTLNDDSRQFFGFNNIGGSSWSTGASYTGPTLYGGFIGESLGVANRTTGDYGLTGSNGFYLRWQTNNTTIDPDEVGRLHIAILFDAESSSTFSTGASGTSYMQVSGNDGGAMSRVENLGDVRWMVRDGTTLYVSQSTIANTETGRILNSVELDTEKWAVYNPGDAYSFNLSLTFDTDTADFSDLNAFGLITYKTSYTTVRHWLGFTEFKVDAVVPEPSTVALVLGFAALGCVIHRRLRAREA